MAVNGAEPLNTEMFFEAVPDSLLMPQQPTGNISPAMKKCLSFYLVRILHYTTLVLHKVAICQKSATDLSV